ncbi:MAG: FIST C-terminal domain-containing protein, partial [Selenomonadaceae bacterium]
NSANLAILVSCVGRKLVLDQLTSEEIDVARSVLKMDTIFTGFYSYGEISSPDKNAICELHNQTMTITLITEV